MNRMLQGLNDATNFAVTENGALARRTTNSDVLDFFSQGGAMRGREASAVAMFDKAWNEDPTLALKTMFYFRDIRGGQGQREAFRKQLKYLANKFPDTVRKNMYLIPEYGRWDDLYVLADTPLREDMLKVMRNQIVSDIENMKKNLPISLLGKWLKSENASSEDTKRLAKITRKFLNISSVDYRHLLTGLRSYLNVVEQKLSANQWEDVEYTAVPSNAMMKYRKGFYRHDEARFTSFVDKASKGEVKINSSTLYPYEIVEKIRIGTINPTLAQAQWTQLPDYVDGNPENSIAVVDVSASMNGTPMNVAVSIGLYLAERCSGPFADHFITFSEDPQLQKIQGTDVTARVNNLLRSNWGYNTNIEAVFDLILNTAIRKRLTQDEMLDKLYIISDMEFDNAMCGGGWGGSRTRSVPPTLMNTIRDKFTNAGYKMPDLVFWNVDARNAQVPMSMDDRGFQNVSGFSPSIFASLMSGKFVGAYEMMLNVIEADRYSKLRV